MHRSQQQGRRRIRIVCFCGQFSRRLILHQAIDVGFAVCESLVELLVDFPVGGLTAFTAVVPVNQEHAISLSVSIFCIECIYCFKMCRMLSTCLGFVLVLRSRACDRVWKIGCCDRKENRNMQDITPLQLELAAY